MLKNKKIFILGMAKSGFEAAKILATDNDVLITDIKEQDKEQVKILKDMKVSYVITQEPTDLLDNSFDLVVKNPGIKYDHPTVLKAKELNIPVINEVELAYKYLNTKVNIIGVTGSNGKTTTVTLIYKILKEAGKSVYLGGNIGTPLCNFVKDIREDDILVLEISDHQLCDMYDFKTNVSVLTNIFNVHTDFHNSHDRYKKIKKRIFNNHTNKDIAIINYDNEESVDISNDINSQKLYFSKDNKQNVYLKDNTIYCMDKKVIDCNEIKLQGSHNYENIMAAISVVKLYDVNNDVICKVLKDFGGVEHRIEYVRTIDGVFYYNDSKSTNCDATRIALNSFDKNTLLILGGLDRGHSFDDLIPYMKNVSYVACYGETKARIKEYCNNTGINCGVFDTLEQAVNACYDKAQINDVVLFSPACASWDQYENFEVRGKEFKNIVNKLKGGNNEI